LSESGDAVTSYGRSLISGMGNSLGDGKDGYGATFHFTLPTAQFAGVLRRLVTGREASVRVESIPSTYSFDFC